MLVMLSVREADSSACYFCSHLVTWFRLLVSFFLFSFFPLISIPGTNHVAFLVFNHDINQSIDRSIDQRVLVPAFLFFAPIHAFISAWIHAYAFIRSFITFITRVCCKKSKPNEGGSGSVHVPIAAADQDVDALGEAAGRRGAQRARGATA